MAESEFVKKWLQKADEDFEYAVSSLREELNFFPQICWHFQQAAEKYLKAYIVAFDLEFKKIHDLTALLKICENKNSDFCSLFSFRSLYIFAEVLYRNPLSCSMGMQLFNKGSQTGSR